MKKKIAVIALAASLSVTASMTAFADHWSVNPNGSIRYNTSFDVWENTWLWLDDNNDGIHECYYFGSNGLATNTVIDGYQVNEKGQWVVDGIVQTKQGAATEEIYAQKSNEIFSLNYPNTTWIDHLIATKTKELLGENAVPQSTIQIGSWFYVYVPVFAENSTNFGDATKYLIRIRSDASAAEILTQVPEKYNWRGPWDYCNQGKICFDYYIELEPNNPFSDREYHYYQYDVATNQFIETSESENNALNPKNFYGTSFFNSLDGKYYKYDQASKKLITLNVDGSVAGEKRLNIDVPEMHLNDRASSILVLEMVNDDKLYFRLDMVEYDQAAMIRSTSEYRLIFNNNTDEVLTVYKTDEFKEALLLRQPK